MECAVTMINTYAAPACKNVRAESIFSGPLIHLLFNVMRFDANPFTCKKKKKGLRVSDFALFLVAFM